MLTDDCKERLLNHKFARAAKMLTSDATREERRLVRTLGRLFGNTGWVEGDMGLLVAVAVDSLMAPGPAAEPVPPPPAEPLALPIDCTCAYERRMGPWVREPNPDCAHHVGDRSTFVD